MNFRDYLGTLTEAVFKYSETKYLDRVIGDIKSGAPLKIGKLGKDGEAVILYDDDVKALERDYSLINKTVFKSASGEQYRFTQLFKGTYSGFDSRTGAKGSERQENGLIELITKAVAEYSDVVIPGLTSKGEFVTGAYKMEGNSPIGSEPYIDIVITTTKREYGISCKDYKPASLAGGGLKGLQTIDQKFVNDIFEKLIRKLKSMGYEDGALFNYKDMPDFVYKIPPRYVKDIFVGTPEMGGPIDHMYIGPMDVTAEMDGNTLVLNGDFIDINQYTRKKAKNLYIRLRKRDITGLEELGIVRFNDKMKGSGMPIIFGNTKSRTRTHLRIVIDDKYSKNAVLVN
jgi:hypothetical protein